MNLDIYIENFIQSLLQPASPALARFFASVSLQHEAIPLEGHLLKQFAIDLQQDWPSASLIALTHGMENPQNYYLLLHLINLDLRTDYFSFQSLDDITAEQSDAIIDRLNLHFKDRELSFSPTNRADCIILSTPKLPLLTTHHLSEVMGRDIRPYLPEGEDALHWRMLMNEMQMLLHDHPVNEQREQARQLAINSVWLEGGGRLPQRLMLQNIMFMSQHDMLRGLARLSACEHLDLVDSFSELEYHDQLVIWMKSSPDLEGLWFEPLLEALRGATVKKLNLHFGIGRNTYSLSMRPIDVWKLWRRTKPVMQYFSEFDHAS